MSVVHQIIMVYTLEEYCICNLMGSYDIGKVHTVICIDLQDHFEIECVYELKTVVTTKSTGQILSSLGFPSRFL